MNFDFPANIIQKDIELSTFESFMESRTKLYLNNIPRMSSISNYIEGTDTCPLLVTGSPGIGKSSLLANWINIYAR